MYKGSDLGDYVLGISSGLATGRSVLTQVGLCPGGLCPGVMSVNRYIIHQIFRRLRFSLRVDIVPLINSHIIIIIIIIIKLPLVVKIPGVKNKEKR